MPYHTETCNRAARRMLLWGIVALFGLAVLAQLARIVVGGYAAGGTRQ